MQIAEIEALTAYRAKLRAQNKPGNESPDIELFGVCRDLTLGVVRFTSISKKYLYAQNGDKFPHNAFIDYYNHHETEVLLSTTESEAWKFFNERLVKRKNRLNEFYNKESIIIDSAMKFISEKINTNPEYFI